MVNNPMECLCLDCPTLLDNKDHVPQAFAVCLPMFPKVGSEAVVCGICEHCAERPDLLKRMVEALRDLCPSATFMQARGTMH
jgi:hypothetical protein